MWPWDWWAAASGAPLAAAGKFVLGKGKSRDLGQENQHWLQDRLQSPGWGDGHGSGRGLPGKRDRAVCFACVLPRVLSPEPAQFTLCDRHMAHRHGPVLVPGWRHPWGQAALEHPALAKELLPLGVLTQITRPNGPLLSGREGPPAPTTAHYRPRQPSWLRWRLPVLRAEHGTHLHRACCKAELSHGRTGPGAPVAPSQLLSTLCFQPFLCTPSSSPHPISILLRAALRAPKPASNKLPARDKWGSALPRPHRAVPGLRWLWRLRWEA